MPITSGQRTYTSYQRKKLNDGLMSFLPSVTKMWSGPLTMRKIPNSVRRSCPSAPLLSRNRGSKRATSSREASALLWIPRVKWKGQRQRSPFEKNTLAQDLGLPTSSYHDCYIWSSSVHQLTNKTADCAEQNQLPRISFMSLVDKT